MILFLVEISLDEISIDPWRRREEVDHEGDTMAMTSRVGMANASASPSSRAPARAASVHARKRRVQGELKQLCERSHFGRELRGDDRAAAEALVAELEDAMPTSGLKLDDLRGRWQLVYSSVEEFRSSPFFWTAQKAADRMGGDGTARTVLETVAPIQELLGIAFGPKVVQEFQIDNRGNGKLVSEVEMWLPRPGAGNQTSREEEDRGQKVTWVTSADVETLPGTYGIQVNVSGTRLDLSDLKRQFGLLSGFFDLVEAIEAPVERIIRALQMQEQTKSVLTITYLDENYRISRTDDWEVYVYTKI